MSVFPSTFDCSGNPGWTSKKALRSLILSGTVLAVLLLTTRCDTTVDVLNPSDQFRYTLFGTLDVAADTQVIRVEPLGDSTRIGAPTDLDASVSLENRDTGEETILRDSLALVGGGAAQVHNVWTAVSIQPATTYRIRVEVNDQTVTSATTTTPAGPPKLQHRPDTTLDRPFRLPCSFNANNRPLESPNTFTVTAKNVEHVAAAKVRYPLQRSQESSAQLNLTFSHYDDVRYDSDRGLYEIPVFYAPELIALNTESPSECVPRAVFTRPAADVIVSAGGPNWPEWRELPLNDLARPDTFSNVEGGHGFVGAVYSDTIAVPIRSRE